MNITGIHPITDIDNYNSIRRLEPLQAESTANAAQENGQQSRSAEAESSYAKPKQAEKQTSFDYAGQYDPKAEYELKGTDSDLMSLDVEKADLGYETGSGASAVSVFRGGESWKRQCDQYRY